MDYTALNDTEPCEAGVWLHTAVTVVAEWMLTAE